MKQNDWDDKVLLYLGFLGDNRLKQRTALAAIMDMTTLLNLGPKQRTWFWSGVSLCCHLSEQLVLVQKIRRKATDEIFSQT